MFADFYAFVEPRGGGGGKHVGIFFSERRNRNVFTSKLPISLGGFLNVSLSPASLLNEIRINAIFAVVFTRT